MSRALRDVLMDLFNHRLIEARQHGRSSIADDLVFPGKDGNPLSARRLQERFLHSIIAKAGLRRFRFHDLRHTFGSLLIEAGAPLPYVRDQMGHTSIQITADKYVHLIPRRNVHFIDKLDELTTPQPDATPAQPTVPLPCQPQQRFRRKAIEKKGWCERGDSNPHPLRDQILSLARLPIPPLSR